MMIDMEVTPRVRYPDPARARFDLDFTSVWQDGLWLAPRPGIKVRELYQADDGYRTPGALRARGQGAGSPAYRR